MSYIPESRKTSFIIVALVYVVATCIGIDSFLWLMSQFSTYEYLQWVPAEYQMILAQWLPVECHTLVALFFADFMATVFTWAMGVVYKNVSVYDPYWSVAPPVLLTLYAALQGPLSDTAVIMLITIFVWAIRLTGNWAYTFKGLLHEDWRYTKFRPLPWPVFQLINFFGLNLVPTIVVFFAMMPAVRIIDQQPEVSIYTSIGTVMCFFAVGIQFVADTTAHEFRRLHPGQVCRVGLWKEGRHPNYFGEILMWWGIWLQSLSMPIDWTIAGAILNTLLFLCISIPLMEARQMKNKPDYAQYRKETRLLI